jgi:membrane associated rhomboid family serine protease
MAQLTLSRAFAEKGNLPPICMRCGAPATVVKDLRFARFRGYGTPNFEIRTIRLRAPLCARHRQPRFLAAFLEPISLIGLGLLGLLALLAVLAPDLYLFCFACGMSVFVAVYLGTSETLNNAGLRAKKIDEDGVTLTGLSQKFVTAVRTNPPVCEPEAPASQEAQETVTAEELYHTLYGSTPVYVTPVVIAVNIALFILMAAHHRSFTLTGENLSQAGASYGPKTAHGEWWRLLTSTFIHMGFLHLLLNMLALALVAPLVERLVGSAGFTALYLASGLLGSLATVWWSPFALSAGASGAVFGVYGALLGILIRFHTALDNERADPKTALTAEQKYFLAKVAPRVRTSARPTRPRPPGQSLRGLAGFTIMFLTSNLAYGLFTPGVGLVAHIAGFATGLLCGLSLSLRLERHRVGGAGRDLLVAAGSGLLIVAVMGSIRYYDSALFTEQHRWASEVRGLTQALEERRHRFDRESQSPILSKRAHAYCELQQWDKAAADFEKAVELNTFNPTSAFKRADDLRCLAIVRLVSGDSVGYYKECARLLPLIDKLPQTDYSQTNYFVYTLAIAPAAVLDLGQVVRLAEMNQKSPSLDDPVAQDQIKRNVGPILYRAGKYEQAIQQMKDGMPRNDRFYCPFLAMAHQRLGKTDEAKTWLEKSGQNLKIMGDLSWRWRETLKLLHHEAEQMLQTNGPKD